MGTAPVASLHSAARTGETKTRRRFGRSLVTAQVAMAVILLSTAALFLRCLSSLENMDLGFQRNHVLLATLDPDHSGYDSQQLSRAYQELLVRFEAIHGVRSATICAASPTSGAGANRAVNVEGYTPQPGEIRNVMENWVAPRYFETLGTRLLKGRDFAVQDQGRRPVAIVNRAMARHYFGNGDPIGRRVTFDGDNTSHEIVGVVEDAKYMDIREPAPRTIYLNTFQESRVASQFATDGPESRRDHPGSASRSERFAQNSTGVAFRDFGGPSRCFDRPRAARGHSVRLIRCTRNTAHRHRLVWSALLYGCPPQQRNRNPRGVGCNATSSDEHGAPRCTQHGRTGPSHRSSARLLGKKFRLHFDPRFACWEFSPSDNWRHWNHCHHAGRVAHPSTPRRESRPDGGTAVRVIAHKYL
jgi:MacB-like periplasmic core domain